MKANPAKLLALLCRSVKADKPIPSGWHKPLVELVEMLMADPDPSRRGISPAC